MTGIVMILPFMVYFNFDFHFLLSYLGEFINVYLCKKINIALKEIMSSSVIYHTERTY